MERINFEEYIEYNEKNMMALTETNLNHGKWLKELTAEVTSIASESAIEMINSLKEDMTMFSKTIKRLENEHNGYEKRLKDTDKKIDSLDELTNTIGLNGKSNMVRDAVRKRCFKFVGKKDSVPYILFYGSYPQCLHAELRKTFNNTYSNIHISKLPAVLSFINSWTPSSSIRDRRIGDLISLNESGHLNKSPSGARTQKALEEYINKTEGGTKKYAIQ